MGGEGVSKFTVNVTITCSASVVVEAEDEADVQRQYVNNVDGIYDEVTAQLRQDFNERNDQFVEVEPSEDWE